MKYLFTIISFLFSFYINAQTVDIKAVEQKGQLIYITYDLKGSPGTYNIKLFVKSNNGYSWSSGLKSVSGNVGPNQTIGSNKQIIWDVLRDRDKFEGDWIFGIEAVNITEKKRNANKEKATIKEKNSGKFSITYMGDINRPIGFGLSFLPNKKIGVYLNIAVSYDFFSISSYDGINLQGKLYGGWNGMTERELNYNRIVSKGQTIYEYELLSFGITRKISYPFWLYLGLGVGYRYHLEYCDTYNDFTFYDSRWISNFNQLDSMQIIPQIGLFLKVKRFIFNSGLLISKNGIYGQFGLGVLLFKGKGQV